MEAKVSILARIPKGEGYSLATLEKKRGSFIKPADALCYYLRYTDATTRKRLTVPAGEDFNAAVVKALNVGNNQSAIRNGQEPAAPQVTAKADRLTIRDAIGQWLASFEGRLEKYNGKDDNGLSPASIAAYTRTAEDFLAYCDRIGVTWMPRMDRTGEQSADEVNADVLTRYQSDLRKNLWALIFVPSCITCSRVISPSLLSAASTWVKSSSSSCCFSTRKSASVW
jgi:hypothetical protein